MEGAHDFLKAHGCCHGNSIIGLIWFISQEGWTGYFARNAQQPYGNMFLSAKSKLFLAFYDFFFSALALIQKCKSLTLPIKHLPYQTQFPLFTIGSFKRFGEAVYFWKDSIEHLQPYSLTALRPYTLTRLQPLQPYSLYTLTPLLQKRVGLSRLRS